MSSKAQAEYILALPIEEWEALKKVLASIKSDNPNVLKALIEAHKRTR